MFYVLFLRVSKLIIKFVHATILPVAEILLKLALNINQSYQHSDSKGCLVYSG